MLLDRASTLWSYMDNDLRGLIADGEALLDDVKLHDKIITDYSYLVFPFSKAYEGFLKKFFLSLKLIDTDQFFSDDIRIGRILNPSFKHEKTSVYGKIKHVPNKNLSFELWSTWKNARNLVFHYYPHNFRKLSLFEAETLINDIIEGMMNAVEIL